MSDSLKKLTKYIFITLGIISLILGVIGIILPMLPTTPFLLVSAYLFYKSSKKLHNWLISNKVLGEYIDNYHKYHAVKRKAKVIAVSLLWLSLTVSVHVASSMILRLLLIVIGIAVTIHILSIKTLEKVKSEE